MKQAERIRKWLSSKGVEVDISLHADGRIEAILPERQADVDSALSDFDSSDAAQQEWEESLEPERRNLRQAAQAAIDDNQAFLALSSPSNAQVLQQVRRLTQQNNAIIRRLIQIN